jgi:hypothetical protein
VYFRRETLSLVKKGILQPVKRTLAKGSVSGKIRGLDVN